MFQSIVHKFETTIYRSESIMHKFKSPIQFMLLKKEHENLN